MLHVQVDLAERSYPIFIGTNSIPQIATKLSDILPDWKHAIIVADEHVRGTIGAQVESSLRNQGIRTNVLQVASGEGNKSLTVLAQLWSDMLHAKSDRKSVVVAIGGGVVGDLAGFAAASYTRGLRFVQVPTTLLAMVDSSVGGKTGINLPEAKNMIGAFWQPHAVWIDPVCLNTLPAREYLSGLAEVVKYGVILDESFFQYLEEHVERIVASERSPEHIEHIVRRSCELKAQVVSHDERETLGLRAILNYGHTFGHAIEATTSYGRYLHGEAIAIGMTMAGRLALRLGLWEAKFLDRQTKLLQRMGLPTTFSGVEPEALIAAMQMDKKTEHGKLNFILPRRLGYVETVVGCKVEDIIESIRITSPPFQSKD
jgi:3-dehydroquinate synthase